MVKIRKINADAFFETRVIAILFIICIVAILVIGISVFLIGGNNVSKTKNVDIVLIINSSDSHILNLQGGSDLGVLTSLNITVDQVRSTSFIGPFSQNEQLYWIDGPTISQQDNVTVIGHFTDGSIQLLIH